MAFPTLVPTSRQFDAGDFPVKTYKAQSGAEVRVLYGSDRTNMTLSLSFANVTDANAQLFVDHYDEAKGTFNTFDLPTEAVQGWSGTTATFQTIGDNKWRYASAPSIANVRPGTSTVTVNLIGVL